MMPKHAFVLDMEDSSEQVDLTHSKIWENQHEITINEENEILLKNLSFPQSLNILYLESIRIDPNDLISNLKNCTTISEIHLIKVEIKGEFKTRIYLPNLLKFIYEEVNPNNIRKFDHLEDFREIISIEKLKAILFFDKQMPNYGFNEIRTVWGLNEILDLPMQKISIKIANWTAILINWPEQTVVLNFTTEAQETLFNSYLPNKSLKGKKAIPSTSNNQILNLAMANCKIELIDLIPSDVSYLNFYEIEIPKIEVFFSNLSKWKNLSEFYFRPSNILMTIDISLLPSTIKVLTLSSVEVTFRKNLTHFTPIPYNSLTFTDCIFGNEVKNGFDKIFNAGKVAVIGTFFRPGVVLLHQILNMKRIRWIYLGIFDKSNLHEGTLSFFRNCGMDFLEDKFVLERSKEGVWSGKNVDDSAKKLLIYKAFGLGKFQDFEGRIN